MWEDIFYFAWIKDTIEHNEPENDGWEAKYISLYGYKLVEEIEENIYWGIFNRVYSINLFSSSKINLMKGWQRKYMVKWIKRGNVPMN